MYNRQCANMFFSRLLKPRLFWKLRMTPKIPNLPVEFSYRYFDEIPPGIIVQTAVFNQPTIKQPPKNQHFLRLLSVTVSISAVIICYMLYENILYRKDSESADSTASNLMNMLRVRKQNDRFARQDRL